MTASRIEARAVFKVAAILLLAIGVALLLEHVVVEVRETIRWIFASIFLALALSPAVELVMRPKIRGRSLPRWLAILVAYVAFFALLAFLVVEVIPPIIREIEKLGSQLPTYVKDFEQWAENNDEFRELNDKFNITHLLSQEVSQLPSKLGDAAERPQGHLGRPAQQPRRGDHRDHARPTSCCSTAAGSGSARPGACASRIASGSAAPASGSRRSSAPT